MPKHIVFDVVGTLVTYSHFFTAIQQRLGSALTLHNLSAPLLGFAWLESAEREYTYLSLSGNYVPFAQVFEAIFFRVLHFAGVLEPQSVATEEDVESLMHEYKKCTVRTEAKECVEMLRDNGWTVWAFTSGDRERVLGYFDKGGVDIDTAHIVTCDDIGVGKPDLKAYQLVKQRLGVSDREEVWYGAAHAWDVSAAGRAGFRTAYCTALEREPLQSLFGTMDVVEDDLMKLADTVVRRQV